MEETKVAEPSKVDPFKKCMKLNDEKKFFVNKNLFENASVAQSKPVEVSKEDSKRNDKTEKES